MGKIIGGRYASKNEFPYVCHVGVASPIDRDFLICGASLLTLSRILTGAQCFVFFNQDGSQWHRFPLSAYKVRAGLHDVRQINAEERGIESFQVHPEAGWNTRGNSIFKHDICLAHLDSSFTSNDDIKVMPFISHPETLQTSWNVLVTQMTTNCLAVGWGAIQATYYKHIIPREFARNVRAIPLKPLSDKKCQRVMSLNEPTFGVVCLAAEYKNESLSIGDSGGPLVCNGSVFGVVSLVQPSGSKYYVFACPLWNYTDFLVTSAFNESTTALNESTTALNETTPEKLLHSNNASKIEAAFTPLFFSILFNVAYRAVFIPLTPSIH